jgi:hypothetical protein
LRFTPHLSSTRYNYCPIVSLPQPAAATKAGNSNPRSLAGVQLIDLSRSPHIAALLHFVREASGLGARNEAGAGRAPPVQMPFINGCVGSITLKLHLPRSDPRGAALRVAAPNYRRRSDLSNAFAHSDPFWG